MKLDGSISAVVTGGASGLGEGTARALAARGVKVALFDLQEEKGKAVAEEIGGVFCEVNVTSDESVDAGFEKARAAHGQGVAGALASGLHHARREHGAGFCTFNGLAIAAHTLLAEGVRRILIVDLDAHCGGGTHSLIEGVAGLRQLDIAVDAFDHYSPAAGNTLDLLDAATDYLPTLRRRLAALGETSFDLCLYNAGMDPHEDCPVGGLAGIDAALIAQRERIVFDWCRQRRLPVAFVLAGGYIGPGLGVDGLVGLHRLTLEAAAGRPPDA